MIVAVGSKNPAKLEGVRRAFSGYFQELEFRPVDSASIARAQPLGLDQMIDGAISRAKFALAKAEADYGVGVEAGIFRAGSVYFDHQQAAITDASGKVSLGHSAGYMLPKGAVERMIGEGKELEQLAEGLTGVLGVGDKGGLVHYLTRGRMSRADLTEQCVMTALAPWLHRGFYDF